MKFPKSPPPLSDITGKAGFDFIKALQCSQEEATRTDRYLHWDKLQYRKPPEGVNRELWWAGIKLHRLQARQYTKLLDKKNGPFSYTVNNIMQEKLHHIDMNAGGLIQSKNGDTISQENSQGYIMSSLIEESIMSSVLEGAVVTRDEAKEIIRAKRKPASEYETMILNNYQTMQHIASIKNQAFTVEHILELHRLMTCNTSVDDDKSGHFRTEADQIYVGDDIQGDIIHQPPLASQLPERMQKLCDFANAQTPYIHPVLRAIILHFWLAYDHPFVDGNGRTARAIFYWSMLKAGYWLFEYVTISHEIVKKPKDYYLSFLYTETDENDLNYFIIKQLDTILKSIDNLHSYIARKQEEQQNYMKQLKGSELFNPRQKALLAHFFKHGESSVTVGSHAQDHRIVRQTARTDLTQLVEAGYLSCKKIGKEFIYRATDKAKK